MNATPQVRIEEDKPPVGTPCVVCKSLGHWCQGDVWCAGDSGNAICNACQNQVDCSVVAKRKQKAPLFEPEDGYEAAPPVRSIPVPAVANGHAKEPIQLPTPPDQEFSDLPQWRDRGEKIARRLLDLIPGETVTLVIPDGMKLKNFERGLLAFLAEYPETADVRWVHGPDGTGTKLVMATEKDLRGRVKRAPMVRPAPKPTVAAEVPKPPPVAKEQPAPILTLKLRQRAKTMLSQGYSAKTIHERLGIPQELVLEIKHIVETERDTKAQGGKLGKIAVETKQAGTPAVEAAGPLPAILRSERRCVCGRPAIHKGRCAERRMAAHGDATVMTAPKPENRSMTIEQPSPADKPELKIATPVTIVTVATDPSNPDMTLSRAFELVIAEFEASADSIRDSGAGSEDAEECAKSQEALINELRAWHPVAIGMSASSAGTSIYERAMQRAEAELRIIELEIKRLEMRRNALKPMLEAMKTSIYWERESR
jgi:hypothetical protein